MPEQEPALAADAFFHQGIVLEMHKAVGGTFRRRRLDFGHLRFSDKAEQIQLPIIHAPSTPS